MISFVQLPIEQLIASLEKESDKLKEMDDASERDKELQTNGEFL